MFFVKRLKFELSLYLLADMQRCYNVHPTLCTLDGCCFDVKCQLGILLTRTSFILQETSVFGIVDKNSNARLSSHRPFIFLTNEFKIED